MSAQLWVRNLRTTKGVYTPHAQRADLVYGELSPLPDGEGLLRAYAGDRVVVASAGSQPRTVNPLAIAVMREVGIDISQQRSKHLNKYLLHPFDCVITVCDRAAEACPLFPGPAQRIHWSFDNPAAAAGTTEDRLTTFRQVRDEIAQLLKAFAAALPDPAAPM